MASMTKKYHLQFDHATENSTDTTLTSDRRVQNSLTIEAELYFGDARLNLLAVSTDKLSTDQVESENQSCYKTKLPQK